MKANGKKGSRKRRLMEKKADNIIAYAKMIVGLEAEAVNYVAGLIDSSFEDIGRSVNRSGDSFRNWKGRIYRNEDLGNASKYWNSIFFSPSC